MRTHSLRFVLCASIMLVAATSHATVYEFRLSGDAAVRLNDAPLQNTTLTLSAFGDPATSVRNGTDVIRIPISEGRFSTPSFNVIVPTTPGFADGLLQEVLGNGTTALILGPDTSAFDVTGLIPIDWLGVLDPPVFTAGIAQSWIPNANPAPVMVAVHLDSSFHTVALLCARPPCFPENDLLTYRWTGNAVFTAAPAIPEPGVLTMLAVGLLALTARIDKSFQRWRTLGDRPLR